MRFFRPFDDLFVTDVCTILTEMWPGQVFGSSVYYSLEQKLPEFKIKYADLSDKGLLWEMVKMEIPAFTVSFTNYKASKKRKEEEQLLQ